ncbi:MAG TPA: tetrathionate reductase family octaheme c-type cytochrome [Accumulibacter sp.]|nr:tetrathionate reductase family octaheme c-type cytochrome [Accumulibacter sp.]
MLTHGSTFAADAPISAPTVKKSQSTADHSKFEALKGPFASGSEVTKACLSCHTEAAGQIMKDKHWTWEHLNPQTNQKLGKRHVINNFCVAAPSNYATCTSCHIGYGWKDENFDFANQENVDCLVCHEKTSGKYRKLLGSAGYPVLQDTEFPPGSGKIVKGADLAEVAQSVGKTARGNCGACHFTGGGGDGVKHGDLDTSLKAPDKALDVHMDSRGLNFACGTCHSTKGHQIPGSRYSPLARDSEGAHMRGKKDDTNPATCVSCHGNEPHKKGAYAVKTNQHTDKVACQTCHIPTFARGNVPTKMWWDWSTAGQLKDGKPFVQKNDKGEVVYDSKKGDFVWANHVVPDYLWFNGRFDYNLINDKVEKREDFLTLNKPGGDFADGKSLIWPFKLFKGIQPFDPVNGLLVVPHVAGKDDAAYWKSFNWQAAIEAGMQEVGVPFSGKVDFIKTQMYWPITHMVAPAKDALACSECHRSGGRLEKIQGVYIPGRDHNRLIDNMGWLLAAGTLLGVLVHGALRIVRRKN